VRGFNKSGYTNFDNYPKLKDGKVKDIYPNTATPSKILPRAKNRN
jgi:hypothetical protein